MTSRFTSSFRQCDNASAARRTSWRRRPPDPASSSASRRPRRGPLRRSSAACRPGPRCNAAVGVGRTARASDNEPRPQPRHGQNERAMALNRKNALFAGHDEGAENGACVASLIETCMCGCPPRCKGFDGDFDAGSAACMCPAYKSRPQPLALMRSADRVLSKLARSRRSHVLLVVPISSIDRRVITSISADAPQQPASPRKRAMFLYRSIDLATRQHVPMRFSPSC